MKKEIIDALHTAKFEEATENTTWQEIKGWLREKDKVRIGVYEPPFEGLPFIGFYDYFGMSDAWAATPFTETEEAALELALIDYLRQKKGIVVAPSSKS